MPDIKAHRHAPRGRIKARPSDLSTLAPIQKRHKAPPAILCLAHRKTGEQCGNPPIPGGSVCRYHGGRAPQVQKKAEERLLEMQPAAIRRLNELMEQSEFPSVAIAATRDVLDRTMGKALERHESGKPGDFALLSDEELRVKLEAALVILLDVS